MPPAAPRTATFLLAAAEVLMVALVKNCLPAGERILELAANMVGLCDGCLFSSDGCVVGFGSKKL